MAAILSQPKCVKLLSLCMNLNYDQQSFFTRWNAKMIMKQLVFLMSHQTLIYTDNTVPMDALYR